MDISGRNAPPVAAALCVFNVFVVYKCIAISCGSQRQLVNREGGSFQWWLNPPSSNHTHTYTHTHTHTQNTQNTVVALVLLTAL